MGNKHLRKDRPHHKWAVVHRKWKEWVIKDNPPPKPKMVSDLFDNVEFDEYHVVHVDEDVIITSGGARYVRFFATKEEAEAIAALMGKRGGDG